MARETPRSIIKSNRFYNTLIINFINICKSFNLNALYTFINLKSEASSGIFQLSKGKPSVRVGHPRKTAGLALKSARQSHGSCRNGRAARLPGSRTFGARHEDKKLSGLCFDGISGARSTVRRSGVQVSDDTSRLLHRPPSPALEVARPRKQHEK